MTRTDFTGWTPVTETSMPPHGSLVRAIAPSGDERELIYDHGLWWLPDRSMYVYFAPVFWRLP